VSREVRLLAVQGRRCSPALDAFVMSCGCATVSSSKTGAVIVEKADGGLFHRRIREAARHPVRLPPDLFGKA